MNSVFDYSLSGFLVLHKLKHSNAESKIFRVKTSEMNFVSSVIIFFKQLLKFVKIFFYKYWNETYKTQTQSHWIPQYQHQSSNLPTFNQCTLCIYTLQGYA